MKSDGWEFKIENGVAYAYTDRRKVCVSLDYGGEGIEIEDSRRDPYGRYSIPFAVIDELRRQSEPQPATPPTSNPDDFDLRDWNPGNHRTPDGVL